MVSEPEQDWIFTFGFGHEHKNNFVRIRGTFETARLEMFRRFGRKWSMQYPSEEEAGVERFALTDLDELTNQAERQAFESKP